MTEVVVSAYRLSVRYGSRSVLEDVSFDVVSGRALAVLGRNGAGKTTLLRAIVGLVRASAGGVWIRNRSVARAAHDARVAYFAGEGSIPGSVRAADWGRLGTGDIVATDRRPVRALSRGSRQLLGLRTVLGRRGLHLVVLDEPWEGLDADGVKWLADTLETKRDRGAAVVVSSLRVADVSALCDEFLVLHERHATRVGPGRRGELSTLLDPPQHP